VETVTIGVESVIAGESATVGSVIIPVAVRFVATSVMDSSIASTVESAAVNSVAASELVSAATRSVTGYTVTAVPVVVQETPLVVVCCLGEAVWQVYFAPV